MQIELNIHMGFFTHVVYLPVITAKVSIQQDFYTKNIRECKPTKKKLPLPAKNH